MALYVNYGCGLHAPKDWLNFDASPSLLVQNNAVLDFLFGRFLRTRFPQNSLYGNILKGLPGLAENSCEGIYCSHVLEHFSLDDLRKALANTYRLLKPGGIFRCVVPDLEMCARNYLKGLDSGDPNASYRFMEETRLGNKTGKKGIRDFIVSYFVLEQHQWMWDVQSMPVELEKAGFIQIRSCTFNDSKDSRFVEVEEKYRFEDGVVFECSK